MFKSTPKFQLISLHFGVTLSVYKHEVLISVRFINCIETTG